MQTQHIKIDTECPCGIGSWIIGTDGIVHVVTNIKCLYNLKTGSTDVYVELDNVGKYYPISHKNIKSDIKTVTIEKEG